MKIVQISDPHMKAGGEMLHGIDPSARLAACVADVNRRHADAAFVVVSGDISDDGSAESYARARDLLRRLKPPVRLMLGNHDSRTEFGRAFPEAGRDLNGFAQSEVAAGGRAFVFLDTVKAGAHDGEFCARRARWLEARLDCARQAGKSAYVFAHHPPMRISVPYLDRLRLLDRGRFAKALAARRDIVRHLFFGHVHRAVSGVWRGFPFSCAKGLNHQVALDMRGEQSPPYTAAPPAYAVILLQGADVVVHHREFLSEAVIAGSRETPPLDRHGRMSHRAISGKAATSPRQINCRTTNGITDR